MDSEELRSVLRQYIGTETYYRHPLARNMLYTDGVQAFANHVGAYWLVDILATQPEIIKTMKRGLASITLTVNKDAQATLAVTDGAGTQTYKRGIDFTDCPEGEWKFLMVDDVIMLPSEY